MVAKKIRAVYFILLFFIIIVFSSLPFIRTTISTRATGITRPLNERTELKPVASGVVHRILYKEGDTVQKEAVIALLRDDNSPVEIVSNTYDINQRNQFIHDLQLLTATQGNTLMASLHSPVYRQQLNRYQYRRADQQASLKKVQKELEMNQTLAKDKVIAPKEMFDKEV